MKGSTKRFDYFISSLLAGLALGACGDNGATPAPDAGAPEADASVAPPEDTRLPETGFQMFDVDFPLDVTPNGRIVLAQDSLSANGDVYFYDTVTHELAFKTAVSDPSEPGFDSASGISANLRISGSRGFPIQASLFTEAGGWVDVPSPFATGCDVQDIASGDEISDDGHVFGGMFFDGCKGTQAFRWSDASGTGVLTMLDRLGQDPQDGVSSNRATVISGDGKIVAGWGQHPTSSRTAAMWTADGHGFLLDGDTADTWQPSEVHALNYDGSVAVGMENGQPFKWTKETGVVTLPAALTSTGDPLVFDQNGRARGVAQNGKLIFGQYDQGFFGELGYAIVWTPGAGGRELARVAKENGISIPDGVFLQTVEGVSSDGTVVTGRALYFHDINDPTAAVEAKGYVLVMPLTAYL